jgi:TPP-dependent trihydroxycyclohexane-1,2-dione (THcHDO) dehydratase
LTKVADLVAGASKPLILCGRGGRSIDAWNRRIALAEILAAPVLTDLKTAATFPTVHRLHSASAGIYINDQSESNRTPYQLSVQLVGNIYESTDQMFIVLVTFQDDASKTAAESAITDIVNDNVLLDGYHRREYTMQQTYLNRAEYRTYSFNLTRLEFQ